MKVKPARQTRFCDIERQQKAVVLNCDLMKSIAWDGTKGERTKMFNSFMQKQNDGEKGAKAMRSALLSGTYTSQIDLHQKLLEPITTFTRLQESDGIKHPSQCYQAGSNKFRLCNSCSFVTL